MKNRRLTLILCTAVLLLCIPLVAMQFTDEVDWNAFDFLVGGILLFGTGALIEFVLRRAKTTQKRLLYCGVVLLLLFLVWAELAVGVFGTPFAGS